MASASASGGMKCFTDSTRVVKNFVPGIIGGELVQYTCGNKFISGLGNTANEAGSSVAKFAELSAIWGISCSISPSDIAFYQGRYLARYSCGSQIVSAGNTFQDVSDIAYELGLIASKSGRFCQTSMNLINASGSGVQVRYNCGNTQVIGTGYSVKVASLDAVSKMKALWP
ncbi:MAG: hypothetical protein Q4G62_07280 [Pseudomonadota bacterium]|nr:hypothetical protein [Pseudomonadota bacterium]